MYGHYSIRELESQYIVGNEGIFNECLFGNKNLDYIHDETKRNIIGKSRGFCRCVF